MITAADRQIVMQTQLFDNVPTALRDKVLRASSVRRYSKNQTIFLQDDPSENVCIVLEGWVKVTRATVDGEEAVLKVCSSGEVLGLSAIICNRSHSASVEAESDVRVLSVPARSLIAEPQVFAEISQNLMAMLCQENQELTIELEHMKTRTAAQRLAEFLLDLCPTDLGPADLSLPYSKSLIARRLGMRPESFSRLLSKLTKHSVSVSGDHVLVGEIAALRSLTNEHSCHVQ